MFESAYCASPLCAPSRSALLAGRRPSEIEVFDNAAELAASTPTIAHLLRAGGYDTVLAGKMHFVGPDQLHGFEERLTTDVYPAGFDWTPDWRLPAGTRLPWYHNMSSLLDVGVREAAMQTDYDDEVCFRAVQRIRELRSAPGPAPVLPDRLVHESARPVGGAARHWDIYDDRAIDPPAVAAIPRAQADPHSLRLRDMSGIDEHPLTETRCCARAAATTPRSATSTSASARCSRPCAARLRRRHGGRVHRRPRRDGRRARALVQDVLPRGLRARAADRSRPRRAAGPCGGAVSQLDLAPTLADLAGIAPADGDFEGASLVPALTGAAWDAAVVSEYLAEGVTEPAVMVRRGRHKLIRCPGDPDLLYDLDADPRELRTSPPILPTPMCTPRFRRSATRAGTSRGCASGCCAARLAAAA